MDEGLLSLPEDKLDKGFENLPLDEDSLLDEQVPSLNGHEAVVPDVEPSPSKPRRKRKTKPVKLAIGSKGCI